MEDLMKCLYDFVCNRRLGSIYEDPEYEEVSHGVEMQLQKIQRNLNAEQQAELSRLLECLSAQNSIENEHLFLASLRFVGELGKAVGMS